MRANRKTVERAVHAGDRCVKDVYAVDFIGIHHNHRPGQCVMFYERAQAFPCFFGELFAVVEFRAHEVRGKDYGGATHRAAEAASAGFVAAGFDDTGIKERLEHENYLFREMMKSKMSRNDCFQGLSG